MVRLTGAGLDGIIASWHTDVARPCGLAPDAVAVVSPTGTPDGESGTVADLVAAHENRGRFPCGVWIEVRDGAVQSITEQWVP